LCESIKGRTQFAATLNSSNSSAWLDITAGTFKLKASFFDGEGSNPITSKVYQPIVVRE
jgi:hypothetical protein|tara:strand:+ start:123 stop:299 length:177 start_codon:yes stop_codon:yes gene_type:complete